MTESQPQPQAVTETPPKPIFVPIEVAGKFFCEFDPSRLLIRVRANGELHFVDLLNYKNHIRATK